MNPAYLMFASVSILGLLGLIHLVLTFKGPKLRPRDPELLQAMKEVAFYLSQRLMNMLCKKGRAPRNDN